MIIYISQNLTDEVSIEELARQFFVSKQTMTRFFKKEFHQSLGKYLQEQRFLRLEKLLSETNTPINTLVYEVGFKNLNSFNRLFKKYYGMSPLQWRKKHPAKSHQEQLTDVANDFLDFQEAIDEKTSRISLSDLNRSKIERKPRIWNLNPETVRSDWAFLEELGVVASVDFVRFSLDFSKISQEHYARTFSFLQSRGRKLILSLSLNDTQACNDILYFFRQLIQNYGMSFVKKIYLEVEMDFNDENWLAEYRWFYTKTIKELCFAQCGIGNLPLGNEEILEQIVGSKEALEESLDFLSFKLLPTIKKNSRYSLRENIVTFTYLNRLFIWVEEYLGRVKNKFGAKLPVFLSDFNLTADQADAINDHLYLGGYYLAFMERAEPLFTALGYAQTADQKSNLLQEEFTGQAGLITVSGLPKVPIFAERFLPAQGDFLLGKAEHLIVSYGRGQYSILAYNHRPMGDYYSSSKEIDIYRNQNYIFDMQSRTIQLEIHDIPDGTYKVTFYILDQENGHGPKLLGKYTGLSRVDSVMASFMKTQYRPRIYQKELVISNSVLSEKLYLKPFEIVNVTYELVANALERNGG